MGREGDLTNEFLDCSGIEEMYGWLDAFILDIGTYVTRKRDPTRQELIKKLEDHIRANFADDISLTRLGDIVQLSIPYLSRIYKEATGVNLKDFISNVRIVEAKKLLLEGRHQVNEVGKLMGYPNAHGFLKFFKTYTGMSPRKFKNSQMLKRTI